MFTFAQFVTYVKTESVDHAVWYAESLGVSAANIADWKRRVAIAA